MHTTLSAKQRDVCVCVCCLGSHDMYVARVLNIKEKKSSKLKLKHGGINCITVSAINEPTILLVPAGDFLKVSVL